MVQPKKATKLPAPSVKKQIAPPPPDEEESEVSELTENEEEAEQPVDKTKEFTLKWAQLLLEYNMNLSNDPLSDEQRRELEQVVSELQ
jgi:hypothetical protein